MFCGNKVVSWNLTNARNTLGQTAIPGYINQRWILAVITRPREGSM